MKHIAFLFAAIAFGTAWAADEQPAPPIPQLRDPYVPPAVREHARPVPETRGPALHAQVERKLRQNFEAADTQHQGSITREQARAAQLGFVVENFDAIDETRSGRVTFDDVKRFLRAKGARTL
jgi:hypothetical protein